MTFSDIFKSSFLEKVTEFSLLDTLLALALSFALGLFIYFVYKKTFRGVMYSRSFGVSLMALSMITTIVIQAVTSNVVLSLGMVGALSIVRFRTAIKEPLDIAFLFWAIAGGIVLGAGLIPLAILGSLVVGIILIVFVNGKGGDAPYLLIVHCQGDEAEKAVMDQVKESCGRSVVKSKSVSAAQMELTLELRLKGESTAFVGAVSALPGVADAVLVSYNGDYVA